MLQGGVGGVWKGEAATERWLDCFDEGVLLVGQPGAGQGRAAQGKGSCCEGAWGRAGVVVCLAEQNRKNKQQEVVGMTNPDEGVLLVGQPGW